MSRPWSLSSSDLTTSLTRWRPRSGLPSAAFKRELLRMACRGADGEGDGLVLDGFRSHNINPVLHAGDQVRSEEHTSELQSHLNLVCRLLLEKKKKDY